MMEESWKLTWPCNRAQAERLTGDVPELAGMDPQPVLVATEISEEDDDWRLDAYFSARPPRAAARLIGRLLGRRKEPAAERLDAAADWVTLSQTGLEPVRAGRFHVHTGAEQPDDTPGIVNFRIDASQAFGTGHHDTTAGCLAALDRLHRAGRRFGAVIDVGTGTGLLAFAALHLWPRAFAIASDIDPASIRVTGENAAINAVPVGVRPGAVLPLVADGTAHPAIEAAAPFDLIVANILAGPLIALSPALTQIAAPGTSLLLAGLLQRQRPAIVAAYRRAGWRLDDGGGDVEWPVLRFTMRVRPGHVRPIRASGGAGQPPGDFGSW